MKRDSEEKDNEKPAKTWVMMSLKDSLFALERGIPVE
jgi:hypothetical protein